MYIFILKIFNKILHTISLKTSQEVINIIIIFWTIVNLNL